MNKKLPIAISLVLIVLLAACTPAITPSPTATAPVAGRTLVPTEPTAPAVTATEKPAVDLLPQLLGVQWVLVSYGEPANPTPVEQGVVVTAEFGADGAVRGSGGCNQYSATYSLDGDQLGIGPIGTTAMACDKGMDQEGAYHAALHRSFRISFSEEGFLQIDYHEGVGGQGQLVFTRSQASQPTPSVYPLPEPQGEPYP
ncbi:MAG: META domain-containing protein [Anaerolineales bacterium]|nr:META domain-containing protein [Anaerolineales bacterium]